MYDTYSTKIWQTTNNIGLILSRLHDGKIILSPQPENPDGEIWGNQTKSLWIESIFLRLPIMPIFAIEYPNLSWKVVAGWQEMNTLKEYCFDQSFALGKMEFFNEAEGLTFSELPRGLERRILETSINVVIIETATPPHVINSLVNRLFTHHRFMA